MRSSRFFGLFVTSILILVSTAPLAEADSWQLPRNIKSGEELVAVEESWTPSSSARRVVFNVRSSGVFQERACDLEYEKGDCDLSDPSLEFQGTALLGPCVDANDGHCIESIAMSKGDSAKVSGDFIRSVNSKTFEAVPSKGLPAFKSTPLYSIPGFVHGGNTTTYAPLVRITFKWDRNKNSFYAAWLEASVYPYLEAQRSQVGNNVDCVWQESASCGVPQLFPDDVRVYLNVRMSKSIAGWFRGRLTTPELSITSINNETNRLEISGEPVRVSRFSAIATPENTTNEEQIAIAAMGGNAVSPLFSGGGRHYPFSHWGDFKWLEMFRDLAKDRASGESVVWGLSTIDGISNNSCLADSSQVLGIVTTNATVYDGNVPSFNGEELQYKVAGMHYRPDGTSLSQGTYDMVMRSATARCLYGFSQAPIKASISVLSAEGSAQVATTASGERDGWLYLSAKNFTFSTPTIKVKLSQEARSTPNVQPSPSPTPKISPVKKASKRVLCLKGSKTLTLNSGKSKCPKGYARA